MADGTAGTVGNKYYSAGMQGLGHLCTSPSHELDKVDGGYPNSAEKTDTGITELATGGARI